MKKFLVLYLMLSGSVFASGWECINRNVLTCNTWRWEVPNGWLVSSDNDNHGAAITFYPDEKHEWKI